MQDATFYITTRTDKPCLEERLVDIKKGKVNAEYISDGPEYDSYELDVNYNG